MWRMKCTLSTPDRPAATTLPAVHPTRCGARPAVGWWWWPRRSQLIGVANLEGWQLRRSMRGCGRQTLLPLRIRMASVFISHRSADLLEAERLANELRAHGHDVWLD